MDLFFSKKNWI